MVSTLTFEYGAHFNDWLNKFLTDVFVIPERLVVGSRVFATAQDGGRPSAASAAPAG